MVLSTARRVLVGARVGPVGLDAVASSLIHGRYRGRFRDSRPKAAHPIEVSSTASLPLVDHPHNRCVQEQSATKHLAPRVRHASGMSRVDGMADLTTDVIEFLSAGTRTGMLGYLASDGRPLVAPIWFVVDDGQLVFNTGKDTAKGRALQRDPRVVLTVDDPHPPFSFVQVQGVAELTEDPTVLRDLATRVGGRYMGSDRAKEFGRRNGVPGELVVRVTPTKVIKAFHLAD